MLNKVYGTQKQKYVLREFKMSKAEKEEYYFRADWISNFENVKDEKVHSIVKIHHSHRYDTHFLCVSYI